MGYRQLTLEERAMIAPIRCWPIRAASRVSGMVIEVWEGSIVRAGTLRRCAPFRSSFTVVITVSHWSRRAARPNRLL